LVPYPAPDRAFSRRPRSRPVAATFLLNNSLPRNSIGCEHNPRMAATRSPKHPWDSFDTRARFHSKRDATDPLWDPSECLFSGKWRRKWLDRNRGHWRQWGWRPRLWRTLGDGRGCTGYRWRSLGRHDGYGWNGIWRIRRRNGGNRNRGNYRGDGRNFGLWWEHFGSWRVGRRGGRRWHNRHRRNQGDRRCLGEWRRNERRRRDRRDQRQRNV
jgi:hypothetical protein